MRNKIQVLSLIISICFFLYWLESCEDHSVDTEGTEATTESDDLKSEEETEEEETTEVAALTEEQKAEEIKNILENPSLLDGKKVKLCMAYVGVNNKPKEKHYCDNAKFSVFFNDNETPDEKELNLNNASCREVTLISGSTLKIGKKCSYTKDEKEELSQSFGEDFMNLRLHSLNHHVPGTLYENAEWKDGKVNVRVECAINKNLCSHKGALVSISMIGEIELSDGSKKYLSSELVSLASDADKVSERSYNIKDFESVLVDTEPSFDDYCGIVTTTESESETESEAESEETTDTTSEE